MLGVEYPIEAHTQVIGLWRFKVPLHLLTPFPITLNMMWNSSTRIPAEKFYLHRISYS